MKVYQHGDVVLVETTKLPAGLTPIKTNVLQEGEMTGHAHRLYGDGFTVFEDVKKNKYLTLVEPVSLRHEEHHEIVMPPGDWEVRIVREYDHFKEEARRVAD